MEQTLTSTSTQPSRPEFLARSLTLMKPVTWFGPMWAFLCGAVASGGLGLAPADLGRLVLGVILAGPVLCGVSQVVNDYFDRDIDAVNEPNRLIPSGKVSQAQIFGTVGLLLVIAVSLGIYLGPRVALYSAIGLALAIIYSAPPLRAKRNGWYGNAVVAISYEGLAWMAGHSAFATLTTASFAVALLYSLGAHGIMTINDYKSMDGDRRSGIRSIPVQYGERGAAWLTIATMDIAQVAVIGCFLFWGGWTFAAILTAVLLIQLPVQRRFLRAPRQEHLYFSAVGVSFFVWGMMVAAIGLRMLAG